LILWCDGLKSEDEGSSASKKMKLQGSNNEEDGQKTVDDLKKKHGLAYTQM